MAKEKAEENDKLKSAFLNNMSHEIRTPMNGILGFSSLLLRDGLSDKKRHDYVRIIESSGEQLLRIIDDIIDYSRIETGQVNIFKDQCRLNETLETLLALLEQEAKRQKKQVEIRINKGLADGNDTVITDRGRLSQILTNLAMNSLKFTQKGYIETGYTVRNDIIEFYVKDTGIGIPISDQHKVFERFHQANIDIARSYSGTGLGLSIARGLTLLLEGQIDFVSKEGKGTTFFVRIPYEPAEMQLMKGKDDALVSDFEGKTILIAEDVAESMELIKTYFSVSGVTILHAQNGSEALEEIKSGRNIDLVLMDIRMPVMDGLKSMKAIKKIRPDIPIIAQTAYAMASDRELYLRSGFDEYLAKPLDKTKLLQVVGRFLVQG